MPNRKQWMAAVKEEMNSLKRNKTWEPVKCPAGVKPIDSKWIFTIKCDENGEVSRFKARLVVRGCRQKQGIDYDETYAPVAKLATIRILLAVSVKKNMAIHQMDVKTAFLNGILVEDVYLKVPDGYTEAEGIVYKLKKSLYGLKQAPRCWSNRFDNFIKKLGFVRSRHDRCLYVRKDGSKVTYLVLYVDDILIASDDDQVIVLLKRQFKREFEMTDLGFVQSFLGIKIDYNQKDGQMQLSQSTAIAKLLEKFNMVESRCTNVPMQADLVLVPTKKRQEMNYPYRELIGSIMYIMLATRPDLCFAVSYLSRFQDKFDEQHWNAAKYVLRYLKGTKDLKLQFSRASDEPLLGYVDADHGRDVESRKSTTGFIFQVYGCNVVWCSRKQCAVSLSSTEAEYIASSLATCEAIWIKGVLDDLMIPAVLPIRLYEDNQSCIKLAKNEDSKRCKHIDVRHHHVRDNIEKGIIKLVYVPTTDQLADMLTKPLPVQSFNKFRKLAGMI